jgi:hypothetical protein
MVQGVTIGSWQVLRDIQMVTGTSHNAGSPLQGGLGNMSPNVPLQG